MEDTYVRLVIYRLHPFRCSASSFNSHYLLLFLKSSRSCVVLPTPFTSVICPSMASWRRQFLLRMTDPIGFSTKDIICVLFSPIRSRTCSLVTFSHHFIFSILLQHHISKLSRYFRSIFLVSRSLSHIKQCSKHLTNFFLSSLFSLLVNSDKLLKLIPHDAGMTSIPYSG